MDKHLWAIVKYIGFLIVVLGWGASITVAYDRGIDRGFVLGVVGGLQSDPKPAMRRFPVPSRPNET